MSTEVRIKPFCSAGESFVETNCRTTYHVVYKQTAMTFVIECKIDKKMKWFEIF